jgi:DNA polymerase, archaea type
MIRPNSELLEREYFSGYTDNQGWLRLLYREGDKVFETTARAKWTSYFKLEPEQQAFRHELARSPNAVAVSTEGQWLRVDWKDQWTRAKVLATEDKEGLPIPNWFRDNDVRPYESNVSPVRRYFVDHPSAKTASAPRIAYLDIETDSRLPFTRKAEMRVLCCAIVAGCDTETMHKGDSVALLLEADTDDAERRELEQILDALEEFDCIAAWYGDGFDFVVLQERCKRLGLDVNWKRWALLDHLEVFRGLNAHVAESGEEKQSMALNNVAQAVLGEGKHDFDASKSWEAWADPITRKVLVDYCIQDTALLLKIEEKTGYLKLFGTICGACQLFMETWSLKTTAQMDGFMLRLGREHGHHFPDRFGEPIPQKYEGAFVLHPTCTGIQRDVHVADFSALYPSIIITWNMSPETLNHECPANGSIPKDTCRAPTTGVGFWTHTEGLLPTALKTLIKMRKHHNDRKASLPPGTPEWDDADRWSTAYKVLANSFYGGLGSIYSRYYVRRVAESVSTTGAWLIKQTIAEAEKQGFEVLYTDTDSAFVKGEGSDIGSAGYEKFSAFVEHCNTRLYPGLVKQLGCTGNRINLAYEKAFKRLVMTAAKKYVGTYAHYKGKAATAASKPEVKGMEFKRGDSVRVARQLQKEVIDLFCSGEENPRAYETIVERWSHRVLEDPLELADVVIAQSINRAVKDYVAKTPPSHVRVAKVLKERGADVSVGSKIAYFVSEGEKTAEVKPAQDWEGECDRFFLWEKRTYPPTRRFLQAAFPEFPWKRYSKVRPDKGTYGALPLPGLEGGKVAPSPIQLGVAPTRAESSVLGQPSLSRGQVSVAPMWPSQASTATRVAVELDARGKPEDDPTMHGLVDLLSAWIRDLRDGDTPVELTVKTDEGCVVMSLPRKVLLKRRSIQWLESMLGELGSVALKA